MQKFVIVRVLEKHPSGAEIAVIAREMGLTELEARACIDVARRDGWNIKNTERRTFQLFEGRYKGRGR